MQESAHHVQPQSVRSTEEADALLMDLLRRRPDLDGQPKVKDVYRAFYQFNGQPSDLERPDLPLTEQEMDLLTEQRLRQELDAAHRDVSSNLFWGPRAISLSEEDLEATATGDQRACLDPTYTLQHLLALHLHHTGNGDAAAARQWSWFEKVLNQASEQVGQRHTMEALLRINTRDLALFNLHQQCGILDARGTFPMHWAAVAARTLLDHRGAWAYLEILLAKQAQDSATWARQDGDVALVQSANHLRPLLDV